MLAPEREKKALINAADIQTKKGGKRPDGINIK